MSPVYTRVRFVNLLAFGLILFLSAGVVVQSNAQTTVTGRLIDRETQKPIKDARISVVGSSVTVFSNELGYFRILIDQKALVRIEHEEYPVSQEKLLLEKKYVIELSRQGSRPRV